MSNVTFLIAEMQKHSGNLSNFSHELTTAAQMATSHNHTLMSPVALCLELVGFAIMQYQEQGNSIDYHSTPVAAYEFVLEWKSDGTALQANEVAAFCEISYFYLDVARIIAICNFEQDYKGAAAYQLLLNAVRKGEIQAKGTQKAA